MHTDKSLHIIGASGFENDSSIKVDLWSRKKRLLRGIKAALIAILVFAVSLFIPILHFIVSPLLLIVGIIWVFLESRKKGIILQGNVICPQCKFANNLKGLPIFSNIYIECKNCHQQLFVEEIKNLN